MSPKTKPLKFLKLSFRPLEQVEQPGKTKRVLGKEAGVWLGGFEERKCVLGKEAGVCVWLGG